MILLSTGIILIYAIVSLAIIIISLLPQSAKGQTAIYDNVAAIATGSGRNVAIGITNGIYPGNGGKTYLYNFNDTSTATPDGINIIQIVGRPTGRWMRLKTGFETIIGLTDTFNTTMKTAAFAGAFTAALTSGSINTALGYTPYNGTTNPNGYITSNNVYTAGYGITKTGTEPNATFSVNTTDIMTANRAADSIASLDTKINGKVPNSRTITINGTTQDLSANRTWTIPTGTTYTAGSGIGISSGVISNVIPTYAGYLTGTAYTLTTTSAKITGGTTSPSITLAGPGTYEIQANVTIDYVGLTTLSLTACSFKLRRTNNTAADIANTATTFNAPVATLTTMTGGDADIPTIFYTTATTGDVIEIWGNRGASVTVGSIQITNSFLTAKKIQ